MTTDIVVAEGVWGPPFEELAITHRVRRLEIDDALTPRSDLNGAQVLVVRNRTQVTRELMTATPALQLVARAGTGLDNVDVAAADDLGVVVVAAAGANAISVAEHAIGLAVAVARRIVVADADTRAGGWDRTTGRELHGGVWGLLSCGATGRATGRLARALGMTVVGYDPYLPADLPGLLADGIELCSLDEVMRRADVVSVHLPSTPATERLVDARLLALAKPGLILVNVGRGECVDEQALADALESGRIAGAGLDVRHREPPVRGRLEALPNTVLTPHVAGLTAQSQDRIAAVLAADIRRVLTGSPARHAATRSARPGRRISP